MKFVLKNAEVASGSGVEVRDVFVEDGKIVAQPDSGSIKDFEEIDCRGKMIMPGAIDVHVHFREPGAAYKETWETGSAAAVAGGITTVFDMPNNTPMIDSVRSLEEKRELIKGRAYCNYGLYMLFDGDNIDEINKAENVRCVKTYCAHSTGDARVDEKTLERALKEIDKGKILVFHCEDEACIAGKKAEYLAELGDIEPSPNVHGKIRAPECALMMTKKMCELAKKHKRPIHIAHVSTDAEMDVIEEYREFGVTCEVAPHHLLLSDDDYEYLGNFIKVNPPVRERADIFGLWKHLKTGNIDLIATDHAPHTIEEKEEPYNKAPSGMPGVQDMLPIFLNSVNDEGLDMPELVRLCCERPAKLFGLTTKGKLEPGLDADIVVVDMELEKKVERKDVLSKCGWSPYEGMLYKGWPVMTFVNGEKVFENGKIVGEKGGKEV